MKLFTTKKGKKYNRDLFGKFAKPAFYGYSDLARDCAKTKRKVIYA